MGCDHLHVHRTIDDIWLHCGQNLEFKKSVLHVHLKVLYNQIARLSNYFYKTGLDHLRKSKL